jgi:hypothetical protein
MDIDAILHTTSGDYPAGAPTDVQKVGRGEFEYTFKIEGAEGHMLGVSVHVGDDSTFGPLWGELLIRGDTATIKQVIKFGGA